MDRLAVEEYRLSPLTQEAIEFLQVRGWSMIPSRGNTKSPCVSWKSYQQELPTEKTLLMWDTQHRPERWGVVTGSISGVIVVDFDGEIGNALLREWGLDPHVRTGGGGHHVYFQHPGWKVPTNNSKSTKDWPFPGVDVRGDGGFIVLLGSNEKGPYQILRSMDPLPFDALPAGLARWLYEHSPDHSETPAQGAEDPLIAAARSVAVRSGGDRDRLASKMVNDALGRPLASGRNNSGFWLAAQCRDNQFSEGEAHNILREYQSRTPQTPHPYTIAEADASVRSAYAVAPRDPWTPRAQSRAPAGREQPLEVDEKPKPVEAAAPVVYDPATELSALVDEIIASKQDHLVYQDRLFRLCAEAGGSHAVVTRTRLKAAFGAAMVLTGAPGAWNERLRAAVAEHGRSNRVFNQTGDWRESLILGEKGNLVACHENAALMAENSDDWAGVLGYNEFTGGHVVIRQGPYPVTALPGQELEDHFDTEVVRWFERERLMIKPEVARRTVDRMARMNSFHPVRDYLRGLPPWDGRNRMESWLFDYCGVDPGTTESPNIFAPAVGKMFLISAVARIFEPGCKADHMLMLEGKTGIGKSTAVKILAGEEFFTDQLSDLGSQNASMQIRGIWIAEIAELHALSKADRDAAKIFFSKQFERFRLPYGKRITTFQRQCVFIGTTESSEWNTDERGARRYWPIWCNGKVDLTGLRQDRDQIWAEALHRYRMGEKWHIEDPAVLAMAEREQAARYAADVWQEHAVRAAEECFIQNGHRGVAISEVLSMLKVPLERQDRPQANRVTACLRFAKWTRSQVRMDGKRAGLYYPPTGWDK